MWSPKRSVNIRRLEFLEPELLRAIGLKSSVVPALDSHFETAVTGLFIVGAASVPPIVRFMYGAKAVTPVLDARLK